MDALGEGYGAISTLTSTVGLTLGCVVLALIDRTRGISVASTRRIGVATVLALAIAMLGALRSWAGDAGDYTGALDALLRTALLSLRLVVGYLLARVVWAETR